MTQFGENEALIQFILKHYGSQILKLPHPEAPGEEIPVYAEPGGRLVSLKGVLDEYRTRPERREGTAHLTRLDSFIEHVNRFKSEASALFARLGTEPSLLAVYDYHPAGPDPSQAANGNHRAEYQFPLSNEWRTWLAASSDEKSFSQEEFAQFLEDNLQDISDPRGLSPDSFAGRFQSEAQVTFATPARVLELAKGLTVRSNAKVRNAVNLDTGERQLTYEQLNTNDAGEPLRVPQAFVVTIPVFEGGSLYPIPVRLRYRVRETTIRWSLKLHRPSFCLTHAVQRACELAQEKTTLPLLYGLPE